MFFGSSTSGRVGRRPGRVNRIEQSLHPLHPPLASLDPPRERGRVTKLYDLPARRTDTDDSRGADAFDDEVRLKTDWMPLLPRGASPDAFVTSRRGPFDAWCAGP